MTVRLIRIAAAVCAVVAAQPAAAQEPVCKDSETVLGCHNRLVNEFQQAGSLAARTVTGGEQEDLQKKATGPNLSEDLAESAIRDFLPRFAGSLLTSDPDNDLRAVDLRLNAPLLAGAGGPRLTLQAGVTLHQAELYEPLVDSIPEGIRDASRKRLDDELEDGDDATAFAAFNLEGPRVGRSFRNHQGMIDTIGLALADSASAFVGTAPPVLEEFEDDFVQKFASMDVIDPTRRDDPTCVIVTQQRPVPKQLQALPIACLTTEMKAQLNAVLIPVTRFEARRQLILGDLLTNVGFDRLSELVNNQPQINFVAEYRSRIGVVGPNEWTGRVRVETGFANVNGLRRFCDARNQGASATDRDRANPPGTVTPACLGEYTARPSTRRRLARSDRLWFAGEVRYRPEYDVSLPEDSVDFTLGSGVGFGGSGGYGRYLGSSDADEEDRDRIDLHVSYDFADGEDLRQSRLLAGVFYTLRISGNASGVVGLTWANKPEFVEGADRQLGANLGLSYKFNRGKEDGQD